MVDIAADWFVQSPILLKGAPIAKFRFLTFEFGVETLTIAFAILQNLGSDGRNYRFDPYVEHRAKFVFSAWCSLVVNFRSLMVNFLYQIIADHVTWKSRNNIPVGNSRKK